MAFLKPVPYMFGNLTWKDLAEIKEKKKVILLLPVGSTESHGPHGPLSTDVTISLEVCLRSAERLTKMDCRAFRISCSKRRIALYQEGKRKCNVGCMAGRGLRGLMGRI